MPPKPATVPNLDESDPDMGRESAKAGRRSYDPSLPPIAVALLESIGDHNDRVIEVIQQGNRERRDGGKDHVAALSSIAAANAAAAEAHARGLDKIAANQARVAYAAISGMFILVVFLVAGVMQLRGIDATKAAEAATVVIDAIRADSPVTTTTTVGGATVTTTATGPVEAASAADVPAVDAEPEAAPASIPAAGE